MLSEVQRSRNYRQAFLILFIFLGILLGLTAFRDAWAPRLIDKLKSLNVMLSLNSVEWLSWNLPDENAAELRRVLEENQALRFQLESLSLVKAENDRLRSILDLPIPAEYQRVVAEVIARSPDHWFDYLTLNAGFKHGIKADMVVLSSQGVIGKIKDLTEETARVELISSPQSAVPCVTEKQNKPAVLKGLFTRETGQLEYLQNFTQVEVGEKILTSGMGNIYPPHLLLGRVSAVEKKSNHPVPEVYVKLAAFEEIIREVIILVPDSP